MTIRASYTTSTAPTPDVLADVTALYIQGHEPEMSVLDLIPNAVRVYATHWGVGPVYRYVIHEADWDDDEFVVIDGTARFESDAPTRTQCLF